MASEEELQKELFEFDDKPKKIFPSIGNVFQKNEFGNKYIITASPERIVFAAIGLVMALVLVYALGMERGKAMAKAARPAPVAKPAAVAVSKAAVSKVQAAPAGAKAPAGQSAALLALATPAQPAQTQASPHTQTAPAPATPTAAFYTIVACTFAKDSTAPAGAARLKSEGLDAYVYQNGAYFQVCVGRFANSADARGDISKVRRYFKDAYVKYRQ